MINVNVFKAIIDTYKTLLERCFDVLNNSFYVDQATLDPRAFEYLKNNGIQAPVIDSFDKNLQPETFCKGMINLADNGF